MSALLSAQMNAPSRLDCHPHSSEKQLGIPDHF
jgi:hypothetical protein